MNEVCELYGGTDLEVKPPDRLTPPRVPNDTAFKGLSPVQGLAYGPPSHTRPVK